MSALSKQQLRRLVEARKRPGIVKLGRFPDQTIERLLAFYEENRHKNILAAALENRSDRALDIDDPAYLTASYAQIELQSIKPGGDAKSRQDYIVPNDAGVMREIEGIVGRCYRSRISTLKPGGHIAKHIDDPDQIRVISVIRGEHNFKLYDKSGVHSVTMSDGYIYVVNTSWEHEVINDSSVERVAVLLNCFSMPAH